MEEQGVSCTSQKESPVQQIQALKDPELSESREERNEPGTCEAIHVHYIHLH